MTRAGLAALAGIGALALVPLAAPPYYAGLMIPFSAMPSRCSASISCSDTPASCPSGNDVFWASAPMAQR